MITLVATLFLLTCIVRSACVKSSHVPKNVSYQRFHRGYLAVIVIMKV